MARPRKEPPLPSSLVPAILRHAAARGLDIEALGWRFGLPRDAAEREEVTAAADVPGELLHIVARAASEPDAALQVASKLPARRHGLAEIAVRASANVREALRRLALYTPLLHEGLEATLEEATEPPRWVLRTPRRPRGIGRYIHELAIGYAIQNVRAGAGDDISPCRVWFTHPRPPELGALQAFLRTSEIAFGCEDSGWALSPEVLDRAMRAADPRTVETVSPLVDAELAARPLAASFSERVAARLAATLPNGTDVREVARAMHMSARTLQRRLGQEDTQFSEVLDRARLGVARGLLLDPGIALSEAAVRLGFADLATFSRAFKRWTGKPPGQWRRS